MSVQVRRLIYLFQVLFRLYPPRYRVDFGPEQLTVFKMEALCAEEQGGFSLAVLVLRELFCLPASILYQHVREIRRRAMQSPAVSDWKRPTWAEILVVASIFFIPALRKAEQFIGIAAPILGYGLAAVIIACIILGLVKRVPRWAIPHFGVVLSFTGLALAISSGWNLGYLPQVPVGSQDTLLNALPLKTSLAFLGITLIPAGLFILFLLILPPLWPALKRLFGDWTLLSFLFYGMAILPLTEMFDEYSYQQPYVLLACLFLAGGALVFLRSPQRGQRFLALAGGLALAILTVAAGKWFIVPLQHWPPWNSLPPDQNTRLSEVLSTLWSGAILLIVMAIPAILALFPTRRMAAEVS